MNIWERRARKLIALVVTPAYWPAATRHRVVASTEFDQFPFPEDIATVLDVGANRGQFSTMVRRRLPRAQVIAFEPVPSAADIYRRLHPDYVLHAVALGSRSGEGVISVGERTDHSSFVYPVRGGTPATVPIRTLDELDLPLIRPTLLKIDVQGFEGEVLAGGRETLKRIDHVLVEVAFGLGDEGHEVLQRASSTTASVLPPSESPTSRMGTSS